MAIAVTYLQRWPGGPRNACTLIDRHGQRVLTYAKVHTCDFGMDRRLTPGDGFGVVQLDTRLGPVCVGIMICYDREFPESARALMLGGAEIILTPNACFLDDNRVLQFRTRAFENMLGVAMTNYARPADLERDTRDHFNGRSVAFSGIAHDEDKWPLDHQLVALGPEERIAIASFDLDALRAYRRRGIWGDAFRKPAKYTRLTSDDTPVSDFVRETSRRTSS